MNTPSLRACEGAGRGYGLECRLHEAGFRPVKAVQQAVEALQALVVVSEWWVGVGVLCVRRAGKRWAAPWTVVVGGNGGGGDVGVCVVPPLRFGCPAAPTFAAGT